MSALICVCSLTVIPSVVPISLQVFAIFLSLMLLGGPLGLLSVALYVALGLIGLPVFSGLSGGIGHIAGPSGGYIIGFILGALCYTVLEAIFKRGNKRKIIYSAVSLIIIYISALIWLTLVYTGGERIEVSRAILVFILPYIPIDAIKLILAYMLVKRLDKINLGIQ